MQDTRSVCKHEGHSARSWKLSLPGLQPRVVIPRGSRVRVPFRGQCNPMRAGGWTCTVLIRFPGATGNEQITGASIIQGCISQLHPGGCQELDSAQKLFCWDVMLANDSSLVSVGCHDQTKCVSQLEQEEPWIIEVEFLVQSLPALFTVAKTRK